MKAEVICIGSELLLGETENTNASYIARKLTELGISCHFMTTVGDNKERIMSALDIAFVRADIIITTGGLGPTEDDITVETISEFVGEELVMDENSLAKLYEIFQQIGKEMPEANKKQALRPKEATVINNPAGTAPGILWEKRDIHGNTKIIMSFPGVPRELYAMWDETAAPYLKNFHDGIILTRHIKFIGISEAELAEKVQDLMSNSNPTVAPLVALGEPRLRIAVKAQNQQQAESRLNETEQVILQRVGQYFYGYDEDTLAEVVSKLLLEKNYKIALAESCTGGLISSTLTDFSGSSKFSNINFVTYSEEAKIKYLGINPEYVKAYGIYSQKTALAMADGARARAKADIGLGISGIVGPNPSVTEKPAGSIFIAVSSKHNSKVFETILPQRYSRKEQKYLACQHALNTLRLFIEENKDFI